MKLFVWCAVALLSFQPAKAGADVQRMPYDEVKERLNDHIGFEFLKFQKNRNLFGAPKIHCATFGERFSGQILSQNRYFGTPFDDLFGQPTDPLSIVPGAFERNLSISLLYRRDWDSEMLLSPVGPDGMVKSGIGEGALAVLFDTPQWELGFRYHAETKRGVSKRGRIDIRFFGHDGTLIGKHKQKLQDHGSVAFGTQIASEPIWGFSVTNNDPGRIYFDDFIMNCQLPVS